MVSSEELENSEKVYSAKKSSQPPGLNVLMIIFFQFRNFQRVWSVLFGRARNNARTSFGTRSRYIDANRSHLRNTSYILNLKRYVKISKIVWLKDLSNNHNYYIQH